MQKKIKAALAGALAVYLAILLFSARRIATIRQLTIAAPPSMVFPYLGKPRLWERWAVWSPKNDAGLSYSFGGPPVGVGMWLAWESENFGQRKLTIKEYANPTSMAYDWEGLPGSRPWRGEFLLEAPGEFRTAATTIVTWRVGADLGFNPVARVSGSIAARRLGGEMQTGLETLRGQLEAEWLERQTRRAEALQRYSHGTTIPAQ